MGYFVCKRAGWPIWRTIYFFVTSNTINCEIVIYWTSKQHVVSFFLISVVSLFTPLVQGMRLTPQIFCQHGSSHDCGPHEESDFWIVQPARLHLADVSWQLGRSQSIGGSRGRASTPNRTPFFCFRLHLCQKVSTLEVGAPQWKTLDPATTIPKDDGFH